MKVWIYAIVCLPYHINYFHHTIKQQSEKRERLVHLLHHSPALADPTDGTDGEKMFAWLCFIVGDQTATDLVKKWQGEAVSLVEKFDRENDAFTQTVKAWKDTFEEELKETSDDDERDAIKAAAGLLDGVEDSALAISYASTDPIDFIILPCGATTQAEQRLVRALGW